MSQILVVDDSATVRNEVSSFLSSNGLSVETAVDGKDALDKMRKNTNYKLVITDVNMPNIDGLTLAEKIRNDLDNHSVNILMLTTENDPQMKLRGKAAKVKGWIVKPFKGENAIGPIKRLIDA